MSLTYRWLGVAGLEFTYQGYTLLVDPHFTRPGKLAVLANLRVPSNAELAARHITRADSVLVTHAHYDHMLDVPEVLRLTGARAYGPPNTCAILALHGIPAQQVEIIQVGDRLQLGPFDVDVFPNHHTGIPLSNLFNGPLPRAMTNGRARLPLRLNDYRMDTCYGFRIHVDGRVLQIGKYAEPADAIFVSPYSTLKTLAALLEKVRPRFIVPIHWDDFMRPLSLPLKSMLITPMQGLRPIFPPLRRMDLNAFSDTVHALLPESEVQIPDIFKVYTM